MSEQQPIFSDELTNGRNQMGVNLEKAIPLNFDGNEITQSSLEQLQNNQNISQMPHSHNDQLLQTQQQILQSQIPLQSGNFTGQQFYQSQPIDRSELQQLNMEMNKNAQINQIMHQFQNFSLNGAHQEIPLQMEQHNQLYLQNNNIDISNFQINPQFT